MAYLGDGLLPRISLLRRSVNRLMVDALGFLGWHHAGALGSARRGSEGRRQSMHQPNDVQFATTQLSTGVRLHYAERGDRAGEAIIFLHGYSDSWFSFSRVLHAAHWERPEWVV
jgi:hypothetical protein